VMDERLVIGVRDPFGLRPLVLGRLPLDPLGDHSVEPLPEGSPGSPRTSVPCGGAPWTSIRTTEGLTCSATAVTVCE